MDVDIGSSAVANGVLGLVFGVVTTLVVDMAFLIQVTNNSPWHFFYVSILLRSTIAQCMYWFLHWLTAILWTSRQANTYEELPEQVIGAARLAHVEPATAVVPDLSNTSNDSSSSSNDNNSNNNGSSEDDSSKKTNWFYFNLVSGCCVAISLIKSAS